MRRTSHPASRLGSWSTVVVLVALCTMLGVAPSWAQAPAAPLPAAPAVQASPAATAAAAPALPPELLEILAPTPVSIVTGTGCGGGPACPPGQLCCKACAFVGCTAMACFPPMRGHCPLFP